MKHSFFLIPLMIVTSLLLGACGASDNESVIATAVALTVQAQASPTAKSLPSSTPAETRTIPTLEATITPTKSIPAGSYSNCMVANLISENPPDGTIYKPGETFFKTWRIQNNSECTWNTSYQVAFWSGDQMGGATYYNFPQYLPPGESADVSIQLAAPDAAGTYKGEWKLKTPDGQSFGVGSYSEAFWTEIVVSTDEEPGYGVTSVTYDLKRDPPTGCPTNTRYTATAHVSFSGPMKEVILQFKHSDGYNSSKIKMEVTEATTMSFDEPWMFGFTNSQGPKWIMLIQIFPKYIEFNKLNFAFQCN
jgi:hypothetical protein